MKKILLSLSILTCSLGAFAQPAAPVQDVLKMKEEAFDFGPIPQGRPVFHVFEVQNTGSTVLKLDNVQASCGCTTPEWKQEPIAAGGVTQIRVGYNAAAAGPFDKHITITYNGGQNKVFSIRGNVWKAPEGSAPANSGVDFLKKQTF